MDMRARTQIQLAALLSLTLAAPGSWAVASSDPSGLCTRAARLAAEATGVPYEALLALSVVETGRDLRPWPWTVNLGGVGRWLDTADEAARLVAEALDRGATNVDIGCFQLNYRWHAAAFHSVEDMLDPDRNAMYAATYLAERYARTGDWALAAAAYHSSTPEHAERYQARFEETAARLDGQPPTPTEAEADRNNSFPLLVAGASRRNGSLVPATPGGLRLFGEP
jgi:Transglycosylase SLT domain